MEKDDQLHTEQSQQSEPQGNPEPRQVCGPNTTPYVVRPGDTFFSIARQFGVSLDALIASNPQIPNPAQIRPGQIVCIPPVDCPRGTFAYTVQRGDTMFSIARMFNVSLQALIDANPQISDPANIVPGQTVCVPVTGPPPGQCPPGTFAYTVQPGDSMFSIAQRFGVPLDDLIAANPQIPNPNLIFPGQIVWVPREAPGPCPPGTFAYAVQPGTACSALPKVWSLPQCTDCRQPADPQSEPDLPRPDCLCSHRSFSRSVPSGNICLHRAARRQHVQHCPKVWGLP